MPTLRSKERRPGRDASSAKKKPLNALVENKLIRQVSLDQYQAKVRDVYGGPKGAILATCSTLSLHAPLGERLFRTRRFDLTGCRDILDVGSGAGQIVRHVLKFCDPQARITCSDLSLEMLRRARNRLRSTRPRFVGADITRLPFDDGSFDCITCGYVLEHLPDPRPGLAELARVLQPGGRILLLTTEDNFGGAWTSRVWYCRTYNRRELRSICGQQGLRWHRELWFTPMHRLLRAGGICVELVKD